MSSIKLDVMLRKRLCIIELYILQKNVKPSHFHNIREKQVFDSHSKENHFVVSKMLNFLNIVLFTETENFSFVLFHLNNFMLKFIRSCSF